MKKSEVAGVVVLYNPTLDVITNINSYISDIDILYVVDNSEKEINKDVKSQLDSNSKIKYITEGKNLGIARALNIGAENAINDGYKYLLTMDQDSTASENMIEKLYKVIVSDDSIAIASPYHYMKNDKFTASKEAFTETLCVMTSGNLLNLEIYKAIGPFLDELFIDFVDVEYCLRIKRNKYKTVVVNDALLTHELGSIVKHGRFSTTNHSAIRRYYITRNRFYVCSKYKKDFKEYYHHQRKQFLKETVKIILWEKDKGEKISATIKGIRDYINKNMGQKIK